MCVCLEWERDGAMFHKLTGKEWLWLTVNRSSSQFMKALLKGTSGSKLIPYVTFWDTPTIFVFFSPSRYLPLSPSPPSFIFFSRFVRLVVLWEGG